MDCAAVCGWFPMTGRRAGAGRDTGPVRMALISNMRAGFATDGMNGKAVDFDDSV